LDHRLKYVVGDFLANLALGALVGLVCWAIVSPDWNMWIAMVAMMIVGMVIGFLGFIATAIKLGAMEAMVPLMFTGMLAGMVVGMIQAMTPLSLEQALSHGAVCGIAGIAFIWTCNSMLRGVTREEEENVNA
jgi:hypothetical protein